MTDLFSVSGKHVLITGSSRGIGLMMAEGYAAAGAAKVYICSRKADACQLTTDRLNARWPGVAVSLPGDLGTEAGCKAVSADLRSHTDVLHVLVNNAGCTWGSPFEEHPDAAWDKVLALNVKATFFMSREVIDMMEKAATPDDPARIINVGSIEGESVQALETWSYSASKSAVHHLTRVMAGKLAHRNVTVNAVAPGPFETKMLAGTLEHARDHITDSVPMGRLGRAADMAGVALYLSSRAGAYVTGVTIPVDGGSLVRPRL